MSKKLASKKLARGRTKKSLVEKATFPLGLICKRYLIYQISLDVRIKGAEFSEPKLIIRHTWFSQSKYKQLQIRSTAWSQDIHAEQHS